MAVHIKLVFNDVKERVMVAKRHVKKQKSKKGLAIVIIIVIAVAVGVGGFAMGLFGGKKEPKPEVAKEVVNPLTGLPFEDDKAELPRPFIVSTDNDSHYSRPQSGLSQADILYEVPIEGGGSRYEPIYYSKVPDLVGAIRSVRPYILDIAREYNAVLVHNGQSPQAKAYFDSSGVDRISAASDYEIYHHEDLDRLPGNLYTTGDKVFERMKKLEYYKDVDVRTFQWLGEDDEVKGQDAGEITINYVDGSFNTFKYDPKTKLYTKYVQNEPLLDANNNEEIRSSNVLVQHVTLNLYDKLRLNLDLCEGGEATVFTQGKRIDGTWSRKDKSSPTIFKDEAGQEIKLTPGVTWIQIIDRTVTFESK